MATDQEIPWEGHIISLAEKTALELRNIQDSESSRGAVQQFIGNLVSELVNYGFSKKIIRESLERALMMRDLK